MANISFPVTVTPDAGATLIRKIAGAAIDAGELVYLDSNGQCQVAQGDALATADVFGMAVNTAEGSGQEIQVCTGGGVTASGAGMTEGVAYFLSEDTAGDLQPDSDNTAGDFTSFIGLARSATNLYICICNTTIAVGT